MLLKFLSNLLKRRVVLLLQWQQQVVLRRLLLLRLLRVTNCKAALAVAAVAPSSFYSRKKALAVPRAALYAPSWYAALGA